MTTKRDKSVKSRTAMWLWAFVILCTGLPWDTWGANPPPLSQVPVPEPLNLAQFVKDKAAAIRLGKALFWDMQAGSDGVQACATCHYRAGADPLDVRSRNQLAPRASASGTSIFQVVGANSTLTGADFPFFQVNPVDAQIGSGTVANNVHDIVGSQGVRLAKFEGVILGSAVESSSALADPTFSVGVNNVRQVTGRNVPSAVNAIFNYVNFWDGRASNSFNGSSPIGPLDVDAGIWIDSGGALAKQLVAIPNASLASQSLGPPLSDVEMSFRGRTFPELGRKMLSLTPLGQQTVHPTDSVLGTLSNAGLQPDGTLSGAKGLNKTYQQMIMDAFKDAYWISTKKVTLPAGPSEPNPDFTQMEANFSLFWGLAIQLYEATLVSDQTPFDKFLAGDPNHGMSPAAQNGFNFFSAQCAKCHSGSELTGASVSNAQSIIAGTGTLVEAGATGVVGSVGDIGFSNIGVRPTADDPGRGGVINFPLSFAGQAVAKAADPNSIPFATFPLPTGANTASPVAVDGAFKVPSLRNVELTPPYFHNGSAFTLDEVVEFYARGGNFANIEMDAEMKPIGALGNATQRDEVVVFLKALTDARAANESAPFDHPELLLPQGDPEQPMIRLPAKGVSGQGAILPTLTMDVTSPTNLTSQTISGTLEKVGIDVMSAPMISINGGTSAATAVNAANATWSFNVTGLVQGENTITATATDLANESRTVTKTILVGITKPVGTIAIDNGAAATRTQFVSLSLSAAGPNPVISMQFSTDSVLFSPYEPFYAMRGFTLPSGDGEKRVYVRFKDSLGNESQAYFTSIVLDTTLPPALTINVTTPTNQASQLITGTLEAGSTLKVTVNTSATVGPVMVSGTSWSTQLSGLKEGANIITVTATDSKGNASTASSIITLDTKPPFLNIDTVLGTKRGTSAGVAGTAEVGSQIAVKCDNVYADVIFFDDLIQSITRWSAMVMGQLHEGDNACTVTATDAAGNVTIKEAHINIDNIPPDLDIHIDNLVKLNKVLNVYGTVESGITPVVTINGSAYAGTMTVNGSNWSCQVSGLTEGANIVTVTATDSAGNKTSKSVTTTAVASSGSFIGGSTPTIADALKALRIAVGFDNPTVEELLRGDLFDDGLIDLSDAILILKKVVGL